MQTTPIGRQPVGGGIRTQDDGGGADVSRKTKIAGRVRGLREGDGGRVAGSPSDDTAWEGKGRQVELDRRSHGRRGTTHLSDRVTDQGGTRECPVEGCPGRTGTRTAMRVHFWRRHVWDIVIILEEGNLPHPRCSRCDMLVPWRYLNWR